MLLLHYSGILRYYFGLARVLFDKFIGWYNAMRLFYIVLAVLFALAGCHLNP